MQTNSQRKWIGIRKGGRDIRWDLHKFDLGTTFRKDGKGRLMALLHGAGAGVSAQLSLPLFHYPAFFFFK